MGDNKSEEKSRRVYNVTEITFRSVFIFNTRTLSWIAWSNYYFGIRMIRSKFASYIPFKLTDDKLDFTMWTYRLRTAADNAISILHFQFHALFIPFSFLCTLFLSVTLPGIFTENIRPVTEDKQHSVANMSVHILLENPAWLESSNL